MINLLHTQIFCQHENNNTFVIKNGVNIEITTGENRSWYKTHFQNIETKPLHPR